MPSIIEKLNRFGEIELSRMHDIGGLRIVVHTIDDIKKVRTIIDNNGRIPPEYEMYTSCLYGLNCYY